MKLGTETASLVNHLQSRATRGQPTPEVGMGATELCWTDRHACTVVSVEEIGGSKRWRHLIGVTRDTAVRTDKRGMDECQDYTYTSNPQGYVTLYASRPDSGEWVRVRRNEAGRLVLHKGNGLRLGERDEYHDFSF